MAEVDEDLVALILSALATSSASELQALSASLASESFCQLQRLWLLVGSPSRCVSIISFLDSLTHHHRRLLLARVTLRLLSRITDFLEARASVGSSNREVDGFAASHGSTGSEQYGDGPGNETVSESPTFDSKNDENISLTSREFVIDDHNLLTDQSTNAFAKNIHGENSCSSVNSTQTIFDTKNLRFTRTSATSSDQCPVLGKNYAPKQSTDADHFDNLVAKLPNGKLGHTDLEGLFAIDSTFVTPRLRPVEPVNSLTRKTGRSLDTGNLHTHASNMRPEAVTSQLTITCAGASFANFTDSLEDLRTDLHGMSVEDEMDDLSLPWGETDAAFLFLLLWEMQEQECQEAMQRWCVDSFVYHLLIVQDMAVLADDNKKAGCIRAPMWRDHLQWYLRQHVLQVGYGFPGVMASANLPASLSAYINTIGRFQRILESMNVEEEIGEQKLPAAAAEVLSSLPATVIGLSAEDKGKVCIICKEELEYSSVASQLPCMHTYHWDCICSWLKQRNNCPVCRFELPSDNYDHELQRKIQFLRKRVFVDL